MQHEKPKEVQLHEVWLPQPLGLKEVRRAAVQCWRGFPESASGVTAASLKKANRPERALLTRPLTSVCSPHTCFLSMMLS